MRSLRPVITNRLSRAALETRCASAVRKGITLREARAERVFVRRQAQNFGVRAYEPQAFRSRLKRKDTADTLFVLGSGSSIRSLTAEQFEEMRSQFSVGINNWGIHPFVADFYALESVPWVGDGKDFSRALGLLSRNDILAARPPLMVLRPSSERHLPELKDLAPAILERVFFYGRIAPSTRRLENLQADIAGVLPGLVSQHDGVFLDSGASVIRMIGVAISLGLSRVVLTGVDLNNSDYFWENNKDYELSTIRYAPENNQRGYWSSKSPSTPHETMRADNRPFPVTDVICALSECLLADHGLRVYASTPESALSELLPVFSWGGKVSI